MLFAASRRHLLEAPSSQDFPPFSSIAIFPGAESQLIPPVGQPSCLLFVFTVLALVLHSHSHGCFATGSDTRVSASGSDV